MFYKYWEQFIKGWSRNSKKYGGWTDPDSCPLFNDPKTKDYSSNYIPEPWWGNDGSKELHSVVINFNPGIAGCCQKRGAVPYKSSYANDIVNNTQILPYARNWHDNKRAKPILEILYQLGFIKGNYSLENHLSIELIPWHTASADKSFWQYLCANSCNVLNNVICFAANESRRIANKKLKNVVIIRMNGQKARSLFDEIKKKVGTFNYSKKNSSPYITPSGKGKSMEFQIHFHGLNGIRFICIWGPNSRNSFPPMKDLLDIIQKI